MWLRILTPPLFLSNLFRKKNTLSEIEEPLKKEPSYSEFLLKLEEGKAKNNQILADMRLQSDINRDVIDSFFNWDSMKITISVGKGYCIYLHDEQTAKFKNQEDIDKYKKRLFKELEEDAIEKASDIPLSLEEIEHIETHPWEFTIFTRSELIKRKNKLSNERAKS